MFYLLGIHGKARTGKDTIAAHLVNHHGYIRNGLADPLKRAAQQMFMLTDAQRDSDELKEIVIPYWGMSPRQMFQKLGTEGGRNVFGDEIWLKRWTYHYDTYKAHTNYVVSDVRFNNEAEYVRSLGGIIIHVTRASAPSLLAGDTVKHASEGTLPVQPHDFVIANDGTKKDLIEKIDQVVAALPSWERAHV